MPKSRPAVPVAPGLAPETFTLLAHDLKNPLAAILANLHYLLGTLPAHDDSEGHTEALADSIALCAALDRMISNLDLIARASTLTGHVEPVALPAMAHQVVARMQPQVTAASQHLTVDAGAAADLHVDADPDLLGRALENVVANALENAPAGSTIDVVLRDENGAARVTVLDDGPVVPPELRTTALESAGQLELKKSGCGRYGRGCGLLAASIATKLSGATLAIGEHEGRSTLELVIPKTAS